jgi:hypothetical protein
MTWWFKIMEDNAANTAGQAAAFQKIWLESITKMTQTLFTFGPESIPPEIARQLRSGIFQALARSWDEFLRSPQFLDGMKQWMDNAVTFRKMSNDFMATVRNELQATSKDDIDGVMLTVRHMEQRVLDRLEALSAEVAQVKDRLGVRPSNGSPRRAPSAKHPPRRAPRKTQRAGTE